MPPRDQFQPYTGRRYRLVDGEQDDEATMVEVGNTVSTSSPAPEQSAEDVLDLSSGDKAPMPDTSSPSFQFSAEAQEMICKMTDVLDLIEKSTVVASGTNTQTSSRSTSQTI